MDKRWIYASRNIITFKTELEKKWGLEHKKTEKDILIERSKMKILCILGIHKFGEWQHHLFQGNKVQRQCKRCFKWQTKRLF